MVDKKASTFTELLHNEIVGLIPNASVVSFHDGIKQSLIVTVRVGDRQVKRVITHFEILQADGGMGWFPLVKEIAQKIAIWLKQSTE